MSISIYGELLVPSEMTEEKISELKQAIEQSYLRGELSIIRDVDREIRPMFSSRSQQINSLGLKLPYIQVGYWCDTGGEPFQWSSGYHEACVLVQSLGYKSVSDDPGIDDYEMRPEDEDKPPYSIFDGWD